MFSIDICMLTVMQSLMLIISDSMSIAMKVEFSSTLVGFETCLRHAEAYNRHAAAAFDFMSSILQCRANTGRVSAILRRQGDVSAPIIQGPCWGRLFANEAVEGPPAAKDPESARGFETQGPATEQGKKVKDMEENFEGWR